MLIDDRLVTVLHSSIADEAAARAQYRQLLDLMGSLYPGLAHAPYEAHKRLDELISTLPVAAQVSILSAPGVRLRNARLIDQLAHSHPQIAEAAIKAAVLDAAEWTSLIPEMPSGARQMLRMRSDLGTEAERLLSTLSAADTLATTAPSKAEVSDNVVLMAQPTARDEIPMDETRLDQPATEAFADGPGAFRNLSGDVDKVEPAVAPAPGYADEARSERADSTKEDITSIADLLQRMERMRQSRGLIAAALGSPPVFTTNSQSAPEPAFAVPAVTVPDRMFFTTDSSGTIISAPNEVAVLFVGMTVAQDNFGAVAWLDEAGANAMRQQIPIRGALLTVDAAPAISGIWTIYAAPLFDTAHGGFTGYTGFLQRVTYQSSPPTNSAQTRQSDAMRQLLHELRTPVNAIQGFAEVIQQQLFGPVPNDYRALAAAVAMDAARLMAGFDEIERFAKLQSNALELTHGSADLSAVLHDTVQRITGALRPHSASLVLIQTGRNFAVGLAADELEQLVWRIVATLAGGLVPGEVISLALHQDGPMLKLIAELPNVLRDQPDVFKATAGTQRKGEIRSISAGMFGTGYSLRLARAEAKAAGGALVHKQDHLELTFPTLPDANDALNSGAQVSEPAAR